MPYDYARKRLSVLLEDEQGARLLITKGALRNVLDACSQAITGEGEVALATMQAAVEARFQELSEAGYRTLGIARKRLAALSEGQQVSAADEAGMTFLGFLVLADPPKAGIAATIQALGALGVELKMITGDNALVARSLARQVDIAEPQLLTGSAIQQMSDAALMRHAAETNVFAEIEPTQKERIILALRRSGEVVGYMGDGINDAPALHAADVGLSVNTAVDVAKEAADFVLLEHDLGVLVEGVREGRRTFANTMKYLFMATSANFGNMFSMAGASLFLPFLPLLPRQILLVNLMTDLPEMTIAGDRVDAEAVQQLRHWDLGFIRRFMIVFGLLSSLFDYLTFGALLLLVRGGPAVFRTGWFVESVVSAALIVLVVRTRGPFLRSRPSKALLAATLAVVGAVAALPYTPLAAPLGFTPLPLGALLLLFGIVAIYIGCTELTKQWFYRREHARRSRLPPRPPALPTLAHPLPSPVRHAYSRPSVR